MWPIIQSVGTVLGILTGLGTLITWVAARRKAALPDLECVDPVLELSGVDQ